MIASTVSSKMLSAVARFEGFTFEETLPGFKWMGHRGQQLKVRRDCCCFPRNRDESVSVSPAIL